MLAVNQRLYFFAKSGKSILSGTSNRLTFKVQKASICHKTKLWADMERDGIKPAYKFPYEKIPYNLLTFFYDPYTWPKMNENSKIVIIEGNVASGKGELGRKLAEELGMKYVGQPELDDIYINSYGFDYRALNPLLPEHLRTCDLQMFHEQPDRHSTIHMQRYFQELRAYQYLKALSHIFNTGEGVVMERSIYTERVIVESMHRMGWLPIGYTRSDGCEFYDWRYRYNYIRKNFCRTLPAPHLTIYLDVPPEECHKRIKSSKDPIVANSNALSLEFLQKIDDYYKHELFAQAEEFGHLVKIDVSDGISQDKIDDLIDEIELLDFTKDPHGTKFYNWNYNGDEDYVHWHTNMRYMTSSKKETYMRFLNEQDFDIAGLGDSIHMPEIILKETLMENHVVGWKLKKYFDWRHTNWLQLILGYGNYQEREKALFFPNFP